MIQRLLRAGLAGALLVVGGLAGAAAPGVARAQETAPELDRSTPRATMQGFLEACREGDYERAARYLDLSRVPEAQRAERGPELARKLKIVLDQTVWVDLEALSNQPQGDPDDGLRAGADRVGDVEHPRGAVPVLLNRVERAGDAGPGWLVSARTVMRVPELYAEHGWGALGELLPPPLFTIRFLEVRLWQWIGLAVVAVLAWALSAAVVAVALRLARPVVSRSDSELDDELLQAMAGPGRLVLFVVTFTLGARLLGLSLPVQQFLIHLEKAVAFVAVTWFLMRASDVLAEVVKRRLEDRQQPTALELVPVGRKMLKALLVVLAVLATLDSFGFNVTAVLAGLGVGGIAVALAAQKSLENLFGGFTLLADRPVRVGDFCRFGDRVGIVEEIGLRSTRVRTLERTLVTVPNAEFSTLQLENFARRDRIWLHPTLGLRYETTPDQLRWVMAEIRRMLIEHARVLEEGARIRFTGFGAYSLDLDVFAYVDTTDYAEFLAIQEDVFLRMMDIVEEAGTGFAFPSQTTYLGKDEPPDEERTREAEERVAAWREDGELPFPDFRPEKRSELSGRAAYPPPGSVLAVAADDGEDDEDEK